MNNHNNSPVSQLFLDIINHLRLKTITEPSNQIFTKGYIIEDGDIKLLDISYGIAFLLSPEDEDEQVLSSWRHAISKGISTIGEKELTTFLSYIQPIKQNYQHIIFDNKSYEIIKLNKTLEIFKNYCEYFEKKINLLTDKNKKNKKSWFTSLCFFHHNN
ncbi:MAG: hypothetical protein HQK79_11430 [Desulfobacterales bacterium]|nr:hypothetical protein [Desulfobacterales bacterium]